MATIKISAKDVKALRDQTGAGMMDCKKALVEANGDMEEAIAYLRKKGQKMTEKRADRDANEGVVVAATSDDNTKGIVVRIGCETDFVAKNDDFVTFAKSVADAALAAFVATKEDLLAVTMDGQTIADKLIERTGVIGEKIELSSYEKLEAAQVVPYIHMGHKAGVIVGFNKANDGLAEAGRNVAMQIAAMKPIAVDKDGVDASVVQKEIEIGMDQARQDGKPEAMLEKIAQGKLGKFYKEKTLLNQEYVKAEKKETVKQYIQSIDKELTVTDFKHVTLG
ncbi:translation elongation factor Ts [Aureispira anguillae]|uniref:Elongation factor Ts n=1 Tax=Aureispira anguillae TaxID=2864201 RepID=A0A915YJX5_9BACT|nr:translation elongation factor Ts [Aureispira anguillae]BDS14579.1 translation elongation factor Ts [Aureispira anguillae]